MKESQVNEKCMRLAFYAPSMTCDLCIVHVLASCSFSKINNGMMNVSTPGRVGLLQCWTMIKLKEALYLTVVML